ncbi:hypothetical protein CA13_08240 [Planctomycetes bacterium CA13]|uniref:Uncharacterized protein n=1 Tax=Novipirellula herctigrandis TaxID=2527986 RepID=A0A5C5YWK1_9BACT|nr:hypothetical protein CA13_08240 [Planctomycetes bacterium CA13]
MSNLDDPRQGIVSTVTPLVLELAVSRSASVVCAELADSSSMFQSGFFWSESSRIPAPDPPESANYCNRRPLMSLFCYLFWCKMRISGVSLLTFTTAEMDTFAMHLGLTAP